MSDHFKEIAVIGISPRNSYYSDKGNIEFVLDKVVRAFGHTIVFIPGTLDRHNYLAYAYEEEYAQKKAWEVSNVLKASVREVCRRRNLSCEDSSHSLAQVRIVDWAEEIENNPDYQKSLKHITQLYEGHQRFREDVRAASRDSTKTRIDNHSATKKRVERTGLEAAVDRAVHYLLGEFAFLDAASKIYGAEKVSYFYHRLWPVFEKYIGGNYGQARPCLRFCVVGKDGLDPR